MDDVAGVERTDNTLHLHLHVVIEISMAAHVEIARNLLHRKGTLNPAAILIFYCLPHILHLLVRVLLSKQLIISFVEVLPVFIESPLLD